MKTKTKTTILPPMTATGKRRLRKLIGFLQELPKNKWNFRLLVSKFNKRKHCGTVCCALGWTPALFPKIVQWDNRGNAVPTNGGTSFVQPLFGMPREHHYLFIPGHQSLIHNSLPTCHAESTAGAVAAMLEKYIALTETEARP